ncbi:TPA: phage antirepressor N-terminal domain-containing protein [Providencia stuartii]|uniref:phage antirepressor N-terminal domain-containing protein n=1 Tax=Providencia stuartii TaxID=588 RepID=UPI000689FF44|nr:MULTISPECIES: phage antirepressor N-terminal domain-containing protein [Providencia]HEM8887256.1 phage antirepressor N-terminal domain-containing protein [Proteus mirabilis]AXO20125.1 phage antirepressor Ant [Providencia stuartii]MBG5904364.1 phage antirepressor N-terminal domain-containing protein [Providencia stuartii]MBG5912362.1 phage antirepressor N-terminal domain-containing protein [Providencia stuartii]MBG5917518.1 phage antirepressor N-terminal domain-containing protein [Providenci
MNTISTINVPFHGDNLYVVNYNGEPHVPMKPIVEGMGLDWKSQFSKIKNRFKSTMVEITIVAADSKERNMICLALRKLAGWLHTISPNKVKPEIRDKVIKYQEECDDVLYEYWTTGEVKKKTNFRQSTAKELIPLRQTAERLIAHGVGNIYPDIWKHVHKEFGVEHINELLPEQIPLAISYLDALEGEYIPKKDPRETTHLYVNKDRDIHNINALAKHFEAIYTAWKVELYPALSSVDSPLAPRLYDRFKDGYSFLRRLQESLNGKHPVLIK